MLAEEIAPACRRRVPLSGADRSRRETTMRDVILSRALSTQVGLLCLLGLLAVAGCGDDESPADPVPQTDLGTTCEGDGECPDGQGCVEGRCRAPEGEDSGVPVDVGPTDAGRDAGPDDPDLGPNRDTGPQRDTGGPAVCDPPCPGNQTCDEQLAFCIEADPCQAPEDCHEGRLCHEGACSDPCGPADCPLGRICSPEEQVCLRPDACDAEGNCPTPGWACLAGRCHPPCEEGGCPSPRMDCDEWTHQCVEAPICFEDLDCLGDRVCIDGACQRPAERCFGDEDCPGDWVCGDGGQCEPPAGCTGDRQCAPLLCDEVSGRCESCITHDDCPGNQLCVQDEELERRVCEEPPFCAGDEDCLGARECTDGRCTPPQECADDEHAGNTSFRDAVALEPGTYAGLVRCDLTEDWFSVAVSEGSGLVATIAFEPGIDLSLALFSPDDPFVPMASSDGPRTTEQVSLGAAPANGDYLVQVAGRPGQQGTYELELRLEEGFCPPDRLEAGGGNDRAASASRLPAGDAQLPGLSICPLDQDWFSLTVERPSEVLAMLVGDPEAFTLALFAAEGDAVLASGRPSDDGLELFTEVPAGAYLLQVSAAVGQLGLPYDLQVEVESTGDYLQQRCDDAPVLVPGEAVAATTAAATADFLPSCAAPGHTAPEALHRIVLDAPSSLRVSVLDPTFDAMLSLRSSCTVANSELGCSHAPRILYFPELAAGAYTLFVDGFTAGSGEYQVLAEPGAHGLVPGDVCEEPAAVVLPLGEEVTVAGDTTYASRTFGPQRCGDLVTPDLARDLVYTFDVAQEAVLTARLITDGWVGLLALYGDTCGVGEQQCSNVGRFEGQPLAPGRYHLVVDGGERFAAGAFQMVLRLDPPPEPPPNDTCAGVLDLTPDAVPGVSAAQGDLSRASATYPSDCSLGEQIGLGVDAVYRLQLDRPAGLRVTSEATFHHLLRLTRGPCGEAARIACSDRGELVVGSLAAGEYFLFVDSYTAQERGPFSLEVELSEPPSACDQPIALVAGGVVERGSLGAPALDAGSCGGAGPEVAHAFTLDAAAQVRFTVSAEFEPVVYVRQACGEAASEIACRAGQGALTLPRLEPGEYHVFVDAAGEEGGAYLLSAQTTPAVEAPANDTCAQAQDMGPLSADALQIQASTVHALGHLGSECGAFGDPGIGPDVFYRFSLDAESEVTLSLQPTFDGVLSVRAGSCDDLAERACAEAVAGGTAEVVRRLPAGDYLVLVTGLDADAEGPFELEATAAPAEERPHPCETAVRLSEDVPMEGDNVGRDDVISASCSPAPGWDLPESVFTFRIVEPRAVQIRLLNTVRPGSLSLRGACYEADSELACSAGAELRVDALPAGQYVVVADGFLDPAGEQGTFGLLLHTARPEGPLPGDACDRPLGLHFGPGGVADVGSAMAGATDTLTPACSDAGRPDLVYELELLEPARLRARLEAGFDARLALRAANACEQGPDLACGQSLDTDLLAAGRYVLIVEGSAGNEGGFDLQVTRLGPPDNDTCADPLDVTFVGDRAVLAGDLELARADTAAAGCDLVAQTGAGADVVYRIRLNEPALLAATAVGDTPLALYLRAGDCATGGEVACGSGGLDVEQPLPLGTYHLFVDGLAPGAGAYRVTLDRSPVPAPPNDSCATPAMLQVPEGGGRVTQAGTLAGARGLYSPTPGACAAGAGLGPDVIYAFDLATPMALNAGVNSEANAVVYLVDAPCGTGATRACSTPDRMLRTGPLAAGRHYLTVDAPQGAAGALGFDLQVDFVPVAANDRCARPDVLRPDDEGQVSVAGDTVPANDDYSDPGCGGDGAPDLVYRFELGEDSDLSITADADFPLTYLLYGANCGNVLVACGQAPGRVLGLPAGPYHLVVDGGGPGDAGSFTLHLDADPAVQRSATQKCQAAPLLALGAEPVVVGGSTLGQDAVFAPQGCGDPAGALASAEQTWRVVLPEQALVSLSVLQSERPAVASLLSFPCAAPIEQACATAAAPVEDLLLSAGEYLLVVDGQGPQGAGSFQVQIAAVAGAPGDDCAEPLVAQVPPGGGLVQLDGDSDGAVDDFRAPACSFDTGGPDVVYAIELQAGMRLTAELSAGFAGGLYLQGECGAGAPLACSGTESPLSFLVPASGTYHLVVDSAALAGPFNVRLLVDAPVENEVCDTALELPLVDGMASFAGSTQGARDDYSGLCGGQGAGDLVYRVVLEAPAFLTANVEAGFAAGLTLYAADCAAQPIDCSAVGFLQPGELPAGAYHLVVDGAAAGDSGAFDLGVSVAYAPDNDDCSVVEALVFHDDVARSSGATALASPDTAASGCGLAAGSAAAPDVVYSFELDRPARVRAEVIAPFSVATYLRSESCAEGPEEACGPGDFDTLGMLAAGTYWLFVDGAAADEAGQFSVVVTRLPVGGPIPDTCDVPALVTLPAAGGLVAVTGSIDGAVDDYEPAGARCPAGAADGADVVHRLDVAVPMTLRASMISAFGGLAYLTQPCGQGDALLCVSPGTPDELVVAAGEYFLVVDGPAGSQGAYSVELSAQPLRPVNDDCAAAAPLVLAAGNGEALGDTSYATDTTGAAGCGAGAPEVFYRFELPAPATVLATLTAPDGGAPGFPSALALLRGPCSGPAVLQCVAGAELTAEALPAGEYFLAVDGGAAAAAGPFRLQVAIDVLPDRNQRCAAAEDVEFIDGRATLEGTTRGLPAVFELDGCGGGDTAASPEAVYALHFEEEVTLSVWVEASDRDVQVYVLAPPCEVVQVQACGQGAQPIRRAVLQAGDYYLVVDGLDAQGPGDFGLALALHPPHEQCEVALPLGTLAQAGDRLVATGDTSLALSSRDGVGCSQADLSAAGDLYYAFTVAEPMRVQATLEPEGFDGVLALLEFCGLPGEVACAAGAGPLSVGSLLPAGSYVAVVDGAGAEEAGPFSLTIEAFDASGDRLQACNQAPLLQAGLTQGDTSGGADLFVAPCAPPGGADQVYVLELPATRDVQIVATPADGSPLRPSLTVYQDCASASGLFECDAAGLINPGVQSADFSWPRLLAGSYAVVVGEVTGCDGCASGAYELETTVSAASPNTGGQACGDAALIELQLGGSVELAGTTVGAVADLSLPCAATPGAGGDRVYRVSGVPGGELTVDLKAWPGVDLVYAIYTEGCGVGEPVACAGDDPTQFGLGAGDVYIVVAGSSALEQGPYRLRVSLAVAGN